MDFKFASRLDDFGEGIFTTLNDLKNKMIEEGKTVYNLSVGTPDFEPSKVAMEAVVQAAGKPENYKYALADLPELIEAVEKATGTSGLQTFEDCDKALQEHEDGDYAYSLYRVSFEN